MFVRGSIGLLIAALLVGVLPALPSAQGHVTSAPATTSQSVVTSVEGERVLELPGLATHVSLSWPDDGHAELEAQGALEPELTIAFSSDGSSFGAAEPVWHDDSTSADGMAHSGVLWTGGARFVRLVASSPIPTFTLTAIDAGQVGPEGTRPYAAAAAVDQPQVISRAGWGADEGLRFWQPGENANEVAGEEKWPPLFFPVQKLIVHHTAGRNDDPDPAATIRAIYQHQAITREWGDIGYNFLIDEEGRIYEGRWSRERGSGEMANGEDEHGHSVQGAHVASFNAGTVGIALLGNLVDQDATPAARSALTWLLGWLSERHSIDPLGGGLYTNPHPDGTSQKDNPNITGHRDWAATACPGGGFYARLPELRQEVATLVSNGGTPGPPPSPPPPPDPPTIPQSLTATAHDGYVIKLSWQPSIAETTGPVLYRVFRNGTAIGSQQTALTYTDVRSREEQLSYQVRAIDAAGRKSALSPPVTVTAVRWVTPPPTSGPSVPQGLTATAGDNFVVHLAWRASTSSSSPVRYRVFRDGVAIGTKQLALTLTDQRKRARTFTYQVRAIDAAGRKSALSPPVTVTTVRRASP